MSQRRAIAGQLVSMAMVLLVLGACATAGDPTATPLPAPTATRTPVPLPTPSPTPVQTAKRIVGYYTSWSIYQRDFQVADIPAAKLTHVNYAFANLDAETGACKLGDIWSDDANFRYLGNLKQAYPHLKVLISVGGWTWSGGFSDAALTDASRRHLVESCIDRFLLGRYYLLTIAAPAGAETYGNIELAAISRHLDWLNLMAYDFHGSWDKVTGFLAPLYASTADPAGDDPDPGLNVHAAVRAYLAAGVPADKLVLGVPFYGRGWAGVPDVDQGLYQPVTHLPRGTWEQGAFDYKDLARNYVDVNGYTRYWHDEAKTPWLYNPETQVFITYDDPESLALKAAYVDEWNLGGVVFWELSADDGSLLDTLYAGLGH